MGGAMLPLDLLFGLSQPSLEVFSLCGRATGSMVGLALGDFLQENYANKLHLPGIAAASALILCQATVNPLLCRKPAKPDRQVWSVFVGKDILSIKLCWKNLTAVCKRMEFIYYLPLY